MFKCLQELCNQHFTRQSNMNENRPYSLWKSEWCYIFQYHNPHGHWILAYHIFLSKQLLSIFQNGSEGDSKLKFCKIN